MVDHTCRLPSRSSEPLSSDAKSSEKSSESDMVQPIVWQLLCPHGSFVLPLPPSALQEETLTSSASGWYFCNCQLNATLKLQIRRRRGISRKGGKGSEKRENVETSEQKFLLRNGKNVAYQIPSRLLLKQVVTRFVRVQRTQDARTQSFKRGVGQVVYRKART